MLKIKIIIKCFIEFGIPLVFFIALYSVYSSWDHQINIWEAMIFGLVIGLVVNGLMNIYKQLFVKKFFEFPVSVLNKNEILEQYFSNCWVEFTKSKLRTKWFLIKTNVAITNKRIIITGSMGNINYRFGNGARIYEVEDVTLEQVEKTKDSYIQLDLKGVGRYKIFVNV